MEGKWEREPATSSTAGEAVTASQSDEATVRTAKGEADVWLREVLLVVVACHQTNTSTVSKSGCAADSDARQRASC